MYKEEKKQKSIPKKREKDKRKKKKVYHERKKKKQKKRYPMKEMKQKRGVYKEREKNTFVSKHLFGETFLSVMRTSKNLCSKSFNIWHLNNYIKNVTIMRDNNNAQKWDVKH